MTAKRIGALSLSCLVVGFLLGFVPEYVAKSHVEQRTMELTNQGQETEDSLHHTERQLRLNEFALQAAVISAEADNNNFADASASASKLFTGLRDFVDQARDDDDAKQPIKDVLTTRDTVIAGLAKADPGVRPVLSQIFQKLRSVSSQAKS